MLDGQGQPNGKLLVRECYNELDERWYQIREQALIWTEGALENEPAPIVRLCIAIDITALKQTQNQLAEAHAELILKHQELEHIASTDPLTQIHNRAQLGRLFAREMRHIEQGGMACSVISVDIDHFKQVNDSFGHAVGDSVLLATARTMKGAVRAVDSVGRWGGEEFLVLCPETLARDAAKLAERIRAAVAAHAFDTGRPHTISVGVATFRPGDTLDTLLQRADQAMYRAKQTGRNRVCTDEDQTPEGLTA